MCPLRIVMGKVALGIWNDALRTIVSLAAIGA
jgi:hypothetical protein